ncbi:hypothetical protein DSUL_20096 [Desulfovibrionales bacterium]
MQPNVHYSNLSYQTILTFTLVRDVFFELAHCILA